MIKEINGRWTCSQCGCEWSATTGDDEIPQTCSCVMIRHWIGKSLSVCTKDILEGTINEEEVLLICTSTRHTFNDPNHFYDMRYFDSTEEAELLQRLWKQGRIHQPRMLSDSYNHGQEEYLFPYDNYRHKVWYSIKDQALTDLEDKPEEEYSEELEEAMKTILMSGER